MTGLYKTLLLVEDEFIVGMMEADLLKKSGYEVIHVLTGEQAIDTVNSRPDTIDLILMDIDLGRGIDGTIAAQDILKAHDIPIVFLSSHTEKEIVEKTEKITSYGYVVKNTGITVLDASIKMAFKLHESKMKEQAREEALRDSEARFRSYFNLSGAGIAITSPETGWIEANETLCRMLGYDREELTRTTWTSLTHPEDLDIDLAQFNRVLAGDIDGYSIDKRFIRKDGSIIWTSLSVRCVRFSEGRVDYLIALLFDITERKRMGEDLLERDDRLRFALESSAIGAWDLDLIDHSAVRSPEHDRIFGYAELLPEWTYEMFLGHVLPEDREMVDRRYRHAIETGSNWNFECRIRRTDGEVRWIWATGRHKTETSGAVRRMAGIVQDITGRKKMEEDLRLSNAFLDSIIENIPVMLFLKDARDLRFVRFNQTGEKLLGYPRAELLGKNDYDFFQKEQADSFTAKDHEVLKGKEVVDISDETIQTKSGAARILHTRKVPILNTKGEAEYLLGISEDITDRIRAEKKLADATQRLESILESANDGIVTLDTDRVITSCNRAASLILGYSREELLGQSLRMIYRSDEYFREVGERAYRSIGETGSFVGEVETIRPDGEARICEISIKQLRLHEQPSGIVGVFRDITERKRSEELQRETYERFHNIINNTDAGYFFIDAGGIIREVNNAWLRMYRFDSMEEVLGKHFSEIQRTEDIGAAKDFVEGIVRGDERYLSGEFSRRCRDGSTGFHSFSARPVMHQGAIIGIEGFIIDTTERRRAEEDLIRSEKLFHALFDSMIEGVALHEMVYADDGACVDYLILDVNGAFERHTGINAKEVRGRKASAAYGTGSAPYIDVYLKVVTTGEPDQFETYFPPMEKHFMISVFRVSDIRFATVFEDITERRRMENVLDERARFISFILQTAQDGFGIFTRAGEIIEVNDSMCRILGYDHSELLKISAFDFIAEEDPEVTASRFNRALSGSAETFESHHRRKDGTVIGTEVALNYTGRDSDLFFCFLRDITERKQAEGQIRSLLAEKELILREVHHRIKNNMNTMISLLTLQAKVMKDPTAASALNDAVNRMRSMGVLYDQLYRSKNLQAMSARDYLSPLVDEITSNFQGGDRVKVDKRIGDFTIGVKELSLLGILVNELVTNIMKYAFTGRDDGLIMISAEMNDNHVTLAVGDNGIGIPESVDISTTNGFGLKLVGGLAGQLNGDIRIERTNGTRVVLEFTV